MYLHVATLGYCDEIFRCTKCHILYCNEKSKLFKKQKSKITNKKFLSKVQGEVIVPLKRRSKVAKYIYRRRHAVAKDGLISHEILLPISQTPLKRTFVRFVVNLFSSTSLYSDVDKQKKKIITSTNLKKQNND